MNEKAWFNVVAGFAGLIVVAGGIAALAWGPGSVPSSTSAAGSGSAGAIDYLYLTIAFNPGTGMDQYFPANFTVPAHELVVVTITNFDNGTNVVPQGAATVRGTVGGVAYLQVAGSSAKHSYSQLAPNKVVHTFSMAQAPYDLNVPLPSATSLSEPTVVTFDAYFNQSGTFAWNCLAPCDMNSMMTSGLMTGTVTVD